MNKLLPVPVGQTRHPLAHAYASRARRSRWVVWASFAAVLALGAWAALAEIDQVAHARGQVIAASRTQIIQSSDGGVLKQMLVKEGERVEQGQLLAILEKERVQAAYDDTQAKVAALKITLTRLRAEVLYNHPLVFDEALHKYPDFIAVQTELYHKRQRAIQQDVAILGESLKLVEQELGMNVALLKTGDIGQSEVIRLRRQAVDIRGQIESRRNKYFQDAQAEMTKAEEDLSTQGQILSEREALLDHTELRAPVLGIVKNIKVTTLGGVLRPGDVLMELLPTDSSLVVEAKLPPGDLGFVRVGLPATVKLDAYDYSIYGSMKGEVIYLSPDALSEDTRQGELTYYRMRIQIGETEFKGKQASQIVVWPGMPVSVDVRTGQRTVLAYLTKPVTKTLMGSLSER